MRAVTPELVRLALSYLSPDCGHDERVRIAFAVFDGLGDAGEDLWKDWAAARGKADPGEDRDTWRSARKPGKTRVGTLFGMAKDRGFTWPDDAQAGTAPSAEVLAHQAAQAERRERERKLAEAQCRERADQAAKVARGLWSEAQRDGLSPYLERKRVQGHGVRYQADGTLLVPMRDADGVLQNLQRIAPQRVEGQPEKRFLPGGRKQGLMHLLGGSAGVCTRTGEPLAVLLLAEGYATAASVHEATGRPVAVCFDAGNLRPVAEALREKHPQALLVVCGDDDAATAERTGENPGRKKAEATVRAVALPDGPARAVFPAGLPADGTDFNDLHVAAGLDRVRELVEAVVAQALDEAQRLQQPDPDDVDRGGEPAELGGDGLSDFERDCLATAADAAAAAADGDGRPAAPWDDEAPPPDDEDLGPSRPGDEAADPTKAGGGGADTASEQQTRAAALAAAQAAATADAAARKQRKLMQLVDGLTKRFTLIYSTDTAWDAAEEMIVRVPAMRLVFGREAVNLWLARPSRRLVMPRDLVFEPGAKVGAHQINMWSGLDLEPSPCTGDDVAPMLALLRHLCSESGAGADDIDAVMHWVLCWQALPLQRIGTKMQTACIFHGAQGTGKNLYWDMWRDLFGDCGITVGQVEIEDKFNGWISRKLAIIGDEVATRQEMYHNKNRLKLVVTQETKFPIRGMQQETRWESNHANVVFLSNESQPLVLEERDRRYMVVYTPLEADVAVYEAVRDFRAAGGLGKWLHYLQQYPVGDFTAHSKPIMTQAKLDLIELGWRGPERFAHEWVEGYLDLPVRVCSAEQLYRAFRRWCDQTGEKWTAQQAIFTRSLERWVRERVQRDPATGRFEEPRLTYKQIGIKDDAQTRRTVRCWVPRGAGPLPGVVEGDWAAESCKAFERDLGRYCRRSGLDGDGADGGGS